MKQLLIITFLNVITFASIAQKGTITIRNQNCDINGKNDWEKVELRVLQDNDSIPGGYKVDGESVVKVSGKRDSIDDLSEEEIKSIKHVWLCLNG